MVAHKALLLGDAEVSRYLDGIFLHSVGMLYALDSAEQNRGVMIVVKHNI